MYSKQGLCFKNRNFMLQKLYSKFLCFTGDEYNKQPSCPPNYDPYVSINHMQPMPGVPPTYSAAVAAAPSQVYPPQNYGYPPPHQQTIGYYQAAAAPPPQHGFYPAPPQAVYFPHQQQPHHHTQLQQQHIPQQQQVGPPPSYGGGPQYPTGYCPPPAYQTPVQIQHHQQLYNHAGPIQVKKNSFSFNYSFKKNATFIINKKKMICSYLHKCTSHTGR